jgi:hypothetical protein
LGKQHDYLTVKQAHELIVQECTKVHEFYLNQIPNYMAAMIQDALLHYGLIAPLPAPDIQPAPDTPPPEEPGA